MTMTLTEKAALQIQRQLEKRGSGIALRIGVNHGSLSERILREFGDTPAGMAESALEFLARPGAQGSGLTGSRTSSRVASAAGETAARRTRMDQQTLFLTILGMAVVTYLPRLLPVWILSSRNLPQLAVDWLRFVPPAVLAALLLPSLVMSKSRLDLSPGNLFLIAAVPTFLVAWKTKSLFASVVVGMALVAAGRLITGT